MESKKENEKMKNGIQLEFDFNKKTASVEELSKKNVADAEKSMKKTQLLSEFNKALDRCKELRLALIEMSDLKVGDDVDFSDSDGMFRKGKITEVGVESSFYGQRCYDYYVLLYKQNGELGKRTSYFDGFIQDGI